MFDSDRYRAQANAALDEVLRARKTWPPFNSAHEGFAVLLEEVDELKAHVWTKQKNRNLEAMRTEALQIAAMAISFAADCCGEQVMPGERVCPAVAEAVEAAIPSKGHQPAFYG